MEEDRRYFIINLPYANIQEAYDVAIGTPNKLHRECLDHSKVAIKTTQERIDAKISSGVPFDTIFPPGGFMEFEGEQAYFDELRKEAWDDGSQMVLS